ncbi:MAG: efflux RND transporter periplasmic adaptor subunit [Planctomycetes bacterium]|jgi:multidrug efflux pump subunit AcrA (membrane-fusion protein)|nr:efflux RND transporter periplasmic adaptor subunit [Planctomycetota bacterium]
MSHVDLSSLRMQPAPTALPKRPWGPRLLTSALALLALAVAATFVWPLLRPQRAVPTAAVRTAAAAEAPVQAMAEAAGWIEPDPFPVAVRPLVTGRIESIAVLEGAAVQAGVTVLAQLQSAGLQAAAERAAALVAERTAQHDAAAAALAVAQAQREQRAALRLAEVEARERVAERRARLAQAEGAARAATADLTAAEAAATGQQQLADAGGSYPLALARARAAAEAASARAAAAARELEAVRGDLAAAESRATLAAELLRQPVELDGAVHTATAALATAAAALASARAEFSIADRELGWCKVIAPVDGTVLRLTATPGANTGPDGEPLLLLYDPTRLRARIDVPLGSIAGVHEGQPVELRSEMLGTTVLRGVVQRLQRESDLLKNTLQVKVQVLDPPPLLRPETLCRARFLGAPATAAGQPPPTRPTFVVPTAAVQDGVVFHFDPAARRARAVPVQVLQQQGEQTVVQGELSPAMRVILVPVQDGESVQEARR